MARLVGTAGHVDHGKTSLIRALTGIDADRLPEEKLRGLTIDIGFAYVDLPDIGRVSIVDVPGHERFLHNMLVGAMGIDVAILCVAADESVKPQTREHLEILDLLPVKRLVVALTRSDLVDGLSLELARTEVSELLAATRFSGAPVLPVSSVTGKGLDELKATLAEQLKGAEEVSKAPWYLPVDRVFTIKGHGAVVTGTLMRGSVAEGDEIELQPAGLRARVRQIQTHDSSVSRSEQGQRTALNLGSVRAEELSRGLLAGAVGSVFATDTIDLDVRWLREPKHGSRVRMSIGADEAVGKVFLQVDDPAKTQVRLERPVGAAVGQPVIVRRYSPPDVLGGGSVVVPQAVKRRRSETAVVARGTSPEEKVLNVVAESAGGIPTEDVCRAVGLTVQALGPVFESLLQSGSLIGFAGLWFTPRGFETAKGQLIDALGSLHDAQPTRSVFSKEEAVKRANLKWQGKPLDRITAYLAQAGLIRVRGSDLGLVGRGVSLNTSQRALLDRIIGTLSEAKWAVPSPKNLADTLRVPSQAILGLLKLGVESGEIIRLNDEVWFPAASFHQMVDIARRHFGDAPFSASEFRDLTASSRKYVIPILEYLDSRGVTFRRGDVRIFVQAS